MTDASQRWYVHAVHSPARPTRRQPSRSAPRVSVPMYALVAVDMNALALLFVMPITA
jgi:hypothetical protein